MTNTFWWDKRLLLIMIFVYIQWPWLLWDFDRYKPSTSIKSIKSPLLTNFHLLPFIDTRNQLIPPITTFCSFFPSTSSTNRPCFGGTILYTRTHRYIVSIHSTFLNANRTIRLINSVMIKFRVCFCFIYLFIVLLGLFDELFIVFEFESLIQLRFDDTYFMWFFEGLFWG